MNSMTAVDFVTGEILNSAPDMQEWCRERQLIWRLAKENGTKVSTIANEIGVSRPQLSRFINETGFRASEEFLQNVRAYLMRLNLWEDDGVPKLPEDEYIKSVDDLDFVITETWKRTWFVLEMALSARNFGMVVGPSGCGKSEAIRAWMERPKNIDKAIFFTANACMTRASILRRIAKGLGIGANADSDTLISRICTELKERPRLIIIDEADQIGTESKLEVLRSILDNTKTIGIALIGNEDLSEYVLRMAVNNRKLARIHNRFGAFQQVKMPTREEAKKILERVHMTVGARDRLISIICRRGGDGGLRVARTMLRILFEAVGNGEITEALMRSEALKDAVLSAKM